MNASDSCSSPKLQLGDKGLLAHQLLMLTIHNTESQNDCTLKAGLAEVLFAPSSPPPGAL